MSHADCLGAALAAFLGSVLTGQGVGSKIDAYLTRAEPFGFAGAVSVMVGGEVVLERGYGGVEAAAPMPIASLSKQFTAAAVLKLEAEGRLRVDDAVADWLPGVPSDKRSITVDQLLTHASGLIAELPEARIGRDAAVAKILSYPLEFEPGSRAGYSNCGYTLLGAIVERASGVAFSKALSDWFFAPLGMDRSGLDTDRRWLTAGAGGVESTVADLRRWLGALDDREVLSGAVVAKLYAPVHGNYARGWRVARSRVFGQVIWHDGDLAGVSTTIRRYVDRGVTLIYFDTTGRRGVFQNKILLLALGDDVTPPPHVDRSVVTAPSYAGTYRAADGAVIVRADGPRLWIGGRGQAVVDALGGAVRPPRALNATTAQLVADLGGGDFATVARAFTDRIPDDEVVEAVRADWQTFERAHGRYVGRAILGTCASGRSTWWTYARLDFERGTELYRFEWDDGMIVGINETAKLPRGAESLPGDRSFAPESGDTFVAFDFDTGRTTSVAFVEDGDGTTILIEGAEELVAVRRSKREPRRDAPAASRCSTATVSRRRSRCLEHDAARRERRFTTSMISAGSTKSP